MIDPAHVPDVDAAELLARYIFSRSHIRASDNTAKADAFMPPQNLEMSVTRHLQTTDPELWRVGRQIAGARGQPLYGRADISVSECINQNLQTVKAPIEGNPNHAHIIDWPAIRAAQKSVAQELASKAVFLWQPIDPS